MKRIVCLAVALCFFVSSTASYAYEAECINKKGKFSTCKAEIDNGVLTVAYSSKAHKDLDCTIPGKSIAALAGGEYARRRVAESVATAVLLAPVFLFMLFAKKKRDNFGIEYVKADGTKDSITIQLKKKYGFAFGQELQAISGQTIVYEDKGPTEKELKAAKKEQEKAAREAALEQSKKLDAAQAAAGETGDDESAPAKKGNKYRR